MKFGIIAIWIMFCALELNAINEYHSNQKLYVYAKSGLKLRASADFNSEVKYIISFKDSLKVLESKIKSDPTFKIKENFPTLINDESIIQTVLLRGNWVFVEHNNVRGYVFDAYLSTLPFKEIKYDMGFQSFEFFLSYFGNATKLSDLEQGDLGTHKYIFNNKLYWENELDDNKVSFYWVFLELSFEEVFLFLRAYNFPVYKIAHSEILEVFLECGQYELSETNNTVVLRYYLGC